MTIKQADVNTENKLLNLMFNYESAVDMVLNSGLPEEVFSYSLNREIFNSVIDLYTDVDYGIIIGLEINILFEYMNSVIDDNDKSKELLLHINKIRSAKADVKHINIYIKTITDYFKIKSVIQASRMVTEHLKDNEDNINASDLLTVFDEAYHSVYSSVNVRTKTETTTDAVKQTINRLIEDSENDTKVKFNLDGIDSYIKFETGYLSYIVGDSGIGKTTMGSILATACSDNGLKVLYVNLETKTSDYIEKIISAKCELDGHRIKYSRLVNPTLLTDNDFDVLEYIVTSNVLNEMGIYWIDETFMTVEELEQHISREVRMHDIDVVIGDYYQLLSKEGYEDSPDGVVIPKVSRELMRIAKRMYMSPDGTYKQLAHIWLAQSVKEIMYRQDKHPQKEDIYYGGYRDARLVLGIYRDEYYNPDDTKKPNVFEIGILKQNKGIVNMWFDYIFETQYQQIREMSDEEKEILEENLNEEEYY